jgi:hypothetical protein
VIATTRTVDGAKVNEVDTSLAKLIVAEALMSSYPAWTDEHGANVEQLAEIAVRALSIHGLLADAAPAPSPPPFLRS